MPASAHAISNAANRACRARSASPAPGPRPWITRIFAAIPRSPRHATVSDASLPELIAEAVIDYQRLQRSATASCPGVGQQSQTHAVGAARDTGRNPRRRLEGAESRHAGGKFLVCDHSRATDHLQAARWLEAAIASRTSGLGLGYSPCSFASVSQAAFFSLMAINELARPSRASGACAPFLDLL